MSDSSQSPTLLKGKRRARSSPSVSPPRAKESRIEMKEIITNFDNVIWSTLVQSDITQKTEPNSMVMFWVVMTVLDAKEIDCSRSTVQNALNNEYNKEQVQECLKRGGFEQIARWPDWHGKMEQVKEIKEIKSSADPVERYATMQSWHDEYIGPAASCLFKTMTTYMNRSSLPDPSKALYANLLSIVQSSGTGKSRMVDELSKAHIVIPITLRMRGDSGFPPADDVARDFLLNDTSSHIRYIIYVTSLFEVIKEEIATAGKDLKGNKYDQGRLRHFADHFRSLMNEGQEYEMHGPKRLQFHQKIVDNAATKLASKTTSNQTPVQEIKDLEITAKQLIEEITSFLEYQNEKLDGPLIILSLDEAHALSETLATENSEPLFVHFRRSLHNLTQFPIFTLFLSTTSKISEFTPPLSNDRSGRISSGLFDVLPPYTEVGFDQLVEKFKDDTISIDEVSTDKYMVKFGRPLFASRYKHGNEKIQNDIVQFARWKLTNDNIDPANASLACLSVRIPLQFIKTRTIADRKREEKLVSDYMRICLHVDKSLEWMITVAPSEPILAQAARSYMIDHKYNLPYQLLNVLDGSGLDKGSRGELIALAILTLACDATYLEASKQTKQCCNAFPLLDFMRHLFPTDKYNMICKGMPSRWRENEDKNFEATFQTSWIYFNHFIQVHDYKVINRKYLWKLIARGAAVLCANNQRGLDIIIPFVFNGDKLAEKSTSAIIIQVKNDSSFKNIPRPYLFDSMDPFLIRFFAEDEEEPVPVIRMVFALASPNPTVLTPHRHRQQSQYTSFDIWCATTSHETFSVIKSEDKKYYDELLKISKDFPQAYEPYSKLPEAVQLRRALNPGTEENKDHWMFWPSP